MVRLTAEPFPLQAVAKNLGRLSKLNGLRTTPIDFNKSIRSIAFKTVYYAFHHEARAFALAVKEVDLADFLHAWIDKLDCQMHQNIIECMKRNSGLE